MTNEQINIAIAEACGWTAREDADGFWRAVERGHGMRHEKWLSERNVWTSGIPDYCTDLNAMHEAEKVLTLSRREVYQQWLYRICEREHRMAPIYWLAITATARQRAEAFLRAIGKWEK